MKARVLFAHRARRIFFFIHLWTGLILGAWFSLIGITGSVLAWRGELSGMELSRRFPIQKSSPDAPKIPLSQAVSALKRAHPDASPRELSTVTIPNRKMPFYSFSRGRNRATMQTILIDPYSARVHPPVRMRTLTVGTIQQFHQRLIVGAKGYIVNGVFNFLAIPLVLSGLWLWWPVKLKHLKTHLTLKRGVSLKRTLYDLHNMMGIYLYVVLLVTTVTGAMLVQQHVVADGGIAAFLAEEQPQRGGETKRGETKDGNAKGGQMRRGEGRDGGEMPTVVPQGEQLSHDELVAIARTVRPQQELTRLEFPQRPDQPLEATYARSVGLVLNETISIDPYSGRELQAGLQSGPGANSVRQITKALHLGEFGGVVSKLIYTITGILPLGLFITGFMLWWRKKRKRSERTAHAS